MRVAFVRSVDLQQANPTLNHIKSYALQNNIELKLFYTDGNCSSELFPGEFEKVKEDIDVHELAKKIMDWGADVVISISLPDNNAHRDSYLKELLERYDIPVIMHPVKTTTLLSNKWETNQWLKRNGYQVPKSVLIYGDLLSKRTINYVSYIDYVISQIEDLKGPYFVKPLWDSMSTGVRKFNDINEIKTFLNETRIEYDFVIEEEIKGSLFGMELVGYNGNHFPRPLVKKCTDITDSLVPFDHVRFGPYPINEEEKRYLEKNFIEICKKLKMCGSVEFEFIGNDTGFYIIEINPRVSGMTNLSSAISGVNTYISLLKMAVGLTINEISKDNFTLEFPLENMSEDKLEELTHYQEIYSVNHVVYHNGNKQYKILLQIENLEEATRFLSALNKKFNIIPSHVFSQIDLENLKINEKRLFV